MADRTTEIWREDLQTAIEQVKRMPLKFENTAEVGDYIKAYDFQPSRDRAECYVIGKVISKNEKRVGFANYEIEVTEDTAHGAHRRQIVFVPFEVSMLEWDGRVTKLTTEIPAGVSDDYLEQHHF